VAQSNYARGRAFEYRTRDKLLKLGALYVMRAAQSKGKADLAVFWPVVNPISGFPEPHWLVQCKTGSARMSPADRASLIEVADAVGCLAVLAQPGPKGRGVEFTHLNG